MKKRFIVMCAALLPLASCGLLDDDKDITPSEGENYVSVSVSDVRDGYFKLDFECGEGTRTIRWRSRPEIWTGFSASSFRTA